jgi:hypothetical protein
MIDKGNTKNKTQISGSMATMLQVKIVQLINLYPANVENRVSS